MVTVTIPSPCMPVFAISFALHPCLALQKADQCPHVSRQARIADEEIEASAGTRPRIGQKVERTQPSVADSHNSQQWAKNGSNLKRIKGEQFSSDVEEKEYIRTPVRAGHSQERQIFSASLSYGASVDRSSKLCWHEGPFTPKPIYTPARPSPPRIIFPQVV